MPLTSYQLGFVIVYFVYGLAFFTMGLAVLLETGRSPILAERKLLQPLAVFGLLHGLHEWIEIYLLQGQWLGDPFPPAFSWGRVVLLTTSFLPLVAFGILGLNPHRRLFYGHLFIWALWGSGYLVIAILFLRIPPGPQPARLDAISRYLFAVPGAILAGFAFLKRSTEIKAEKMIRAGHPDRLAGCFQAAAIGFIVYGLTQIFVPRGDLFPTTIINADAFMQFTGVPVQVIRAAVAVLITVNLIRAIQIVADEREERLLSAQHDRLEALEQIHQELEAREGMRRDLLRHTVIAQEEERTRIARELHDETSQILTALNLNLATLTKVLPHRSEVRELSDRLQGLSRQMAQGVYRMVHDLRPAQLDDLGLVAALQYLADEERQRAGLDVFIEVEGQRHRLDSLVETVIFRVAQEALTNTARHASTDRAWIRLAFLENQVTLIVRDQGCGFDPNLDLIPPRGWGLAGMRERIESVGGQLNITSASGQGTQVEAFIPIVEHEKKENVHE